MKIIIIIEKYGGFCNRFFQSLHYHAFSIENNNILIGSYGDDESKSNSGSSYINTIPKTWINFCQLKEICISLKLEN